MKELRTAILSHSKDLDGVLSAVIAERYISARKEKAPDVFLCDYGDIPKEFDHKNYDEIYVLDFSDHDLFTNDLTRGKIFWIDHHASEINKGYHVKQYTMDGVAACRLVFQFFTNINYAFVSKEDYVNRKVVEPAMVTLAGEYDIWDLDSPYARVFNFGIQDISLKNVGNIFTTTFSASLNHKEKDGDDLTSIQYQSMILSSIIRIGESVVEYLSNTSKRIGDYEVKRVYGVNLAIFNTHIKSSLIHTLKPEEDGMMVYSIKDGIVSASLYTERDVDVSRIAIANGGGGHKKACGFKMPVAEFFKWLY